METAWSRSMSVGEEYGLNVVNDLDGNYVTTWFSGNSECVLARPIRLRPWWSRRLKNLESNWVLFRHRGVLDVDVITQAGRPYILDINPRFGGQYPFWHEAGADIPSALMAWRRGESRTGVAYGGSGIRHFKDIVLIMCPVKSSRFAICIISGDGTWHKSSAH